MYDNGDGKKFAVAANAEFLFIYIVNPFIFVVSNGFAGSLFSTDNSWSSIRGG